MVKKSVDDLFPGLTSHKEILFFCNRSFLLLNFTTICRERNLVDSMSCCATHFCDQSLLNSLILVLMMDTSEEYGPSICDNLRKIESYCRNLDSDGYILY